MKGAGHVARMGRVAYKGVMGKHEGRKQLGRARRRWEDDVKMDLQIMR